jgi:hypothetical protein
LGVRLRHEPPAPGVKPLEVNLVILTEGGCAHAALGLLLGPPLPMGDSFLSGHRTPSEFYGLIDNGEHHN